MDDGVARSLNQRLRNLASEEGVDVLRLRNRLLFQRILHRLSGDERWILKGGFALETRLWLDSRATKDLDLARREASAPDADELHDLLDSALDRDTGDGFRFAPRRPRQVKAEDELPTTWRVVIDAHVGSILFGSATLDVITASALDSEEVEPLVVAPILGGEEFTVLAVDVNRHAAEKFHAYSRIYAHERPSSRVKDLVDLTLLADRGLLDPAALATRLVNVFSERDEREPPTDLPPPPGHWAETFAAMSADLGLSTVESAAAHHRVREEYQRALSTLRKDTP
nr:nucleotidyl transferase AbiEii/AbiGii toxin family protein [Dietzia sp. SLG310A2-38A2]